MTILLYCIGAALLVLTRRVVSGGLRLPQRPPKHEDDPASRQMTRSAAIWLR